MPLHTAKLSSSRQVYLSKEVLEEANLDVDTTFVVRVRAGGVIELVPERIAKQVLDAGLENLRQASYRRLEQLWDNEDDEVWNDV